MDMRKKKKQYSYIPKIDFYPKLQYVTEIKIKNNTIYIYSQFNEVMLIIQLFAQHGQQKIMKKQLDLELNNFYFMNQSNQFVNFDFGAIQIWRIDHKYNYSKFQSILNDKNEFVVSLVISQNDDLIVNSMGKGALYFWKKDIDWKCYLKIQDQWGYLRNLNLNQKEDNLLANNDQTLFLFSYNPNNKQNEWQLKEKINKKYKAQCFIDETNFACISDLNVVTIYKISANLRQLQNISLTEKIKSVQHWTLLEYSTRKQLFLVYIDNKLFLIGKNSNKHYILQQKIYLAQQTHFMTFSKNQDFLLIVIKSTFDEDEDICRKIELRRFLMIG